MKRPTSFDIAALAGVSQATVSRALSAASPVSDDVRRRVLEAAAKLNYVVDTNARKLRSKKINTIAVLVSQDLDQTDNRINPFFLPLIGSILAYADEKGIDVLMSLQNQGADWGLDYGFARRADGIIFLGYRDFEAYTRRIENLRRIGEPWVVFGPVMKEDPDLFVGSDNAGGAHAAVAHLLARAAGASFSWARRPNTIRNSSNATRAICAPISRRAWRPTATSASIVSSRARKAPRRSTGYSRARSNSTPSSRSPTCWP